MILSAFHATGLPLQALAKILLNTHASPTTRSAMIHTLGRDAGVIDGDGNVMLGALTATCQVRLWSMALHDGSASLDTAATLAPDWTVASSDSLLEASLLALHSWASSPVSRALRGICATRSACLALVADPGPTGDGGPPDSVGRRQGARRPTNRFGSASRTQY